MTALRRRLVARIAEFGPISVADYMAHCLFDPDHGYYTTREPFGVEGDFTTAPEISQMFGELVAAFLLSAWHRLGRPAPVTLAEIGPGRGTLMKDMLRTIRKLEPGFGEAAHVGLIEISPRLREIQARTLAGAPFRIAWHDGIDDLPAAPLLIVGNELFDALPMRQFVRTPTGWRERMVDTTESGDLIFAAGTASLDERLLPTAAKDAPDGTIVEFAPARTALMQRLAERIAAGSGVGLFIDYGHLVSGTGDTLQALRRHRFDPPLAHPGEADLTSHVDFEPLAATARAAGLATAALTQGRFLLELGLLERAGRLGASADATAREGIRLEVERLAGPDQMGELFKALCIASPNHMPPPFASH